MSEAAFQKSVCEQLTWHGRRVLRVSDAAAARHYVYGLRAIVSPPIASSGADLLVLPATGMPCVLARSQEAIASALETNPGAFFLELKDPMDRNHGKGPRADQGPQNDWMRWVSGGRR